MLVPEAPMDEDGDPAGEKHEVRPTRQVLSVESKAQATVVQVATDGHLGLRILAPYHRHHLTAR